MNPDLSFIARLMALFSRPCTNPGNRLQYKRVNGPYELIVTATGEYKLPFGNLPCPLLAEGSLSEFWEWLLSAVALLALKRGSATR